MSTQVLNRVTTDNVSLEIKDPVDPTALGQAKAIIDELLSANGMSVGETQLLEVAKRLGDVPEDATSVLISKEECKAAFDSLSDQERTALVNIHGRVKVFAEMQRKSVVDMEMDIPGGKAGHTVSACKGKQYSFSSNSDGVNLTLTWDIIIALYCSCRLLCSRWPLSPALVGSHDRCDGSGRWLRHGHLGQSETG